MSENNQVHPLSHLEELVIERIKDVAPDGREKSLAITNIEQGFMWLSKALEVDKF